MRVEAITYAVADRRSSAAMYALLDEVFNGSGPGRALSRFEYSWLPVSIACS